MALPLIGGGHLPGFWSADPLVVLSNDQLFEFELFDEHPQRRDYRPQDHPELPFEIAKLADASDDEIVRFARHWGVLGYVALSMARTARIMNYMQPPPKMGPVEGGEPLAWIRRHGGRMRLCIDLADPLRDGDPDAAVEPLGKFFERDPETRRWEALLRGLLFKGEGKPEPNPISRALETDPLGVARLLLDILVNDLIEGIEPRLELGDGEGPRVTFHFDAMIQVAYFHLAHLLSERAKISYCAECDSPFKKTDERQRFCPPDRFERGSESKCSNRQRYRRWSKAHPRRKGEKT